MGVMIVRHSIRDYEAWRPVYDAHETARRAVGLTSGRIYPCYMSCRLLLHLPHE